MARVFTPLLLALLWLLSQLPLPLLAWLGRARRSAVVVAGAQPPRGGAAQPGVVHARVERSAAPRGGARALRAASVAGLVEHGLSWYASRERLKRLIHVEGDVALAERSERPVMWLVPHFIGARHRRRGGAAVPVAPGGVGVPAAEQSGVRRRDACAAACASATRGRLYSRFEARAR